MKRNILIISVSIIIILVILIIAYPSFFIFKPYAHSGGFAGLPQDTALQSLKSVGTEAALGATGEAIGVTVGSTIKLMKNGFLKVADKSLNEGWYDKFVEGFGKVGAGASPKETSFAIQSVKRGDNRVLHSQFANEKFPLIMANEVIYGGVDKSLSDNIIKLSKEGSNKISVTSLMKEFAGVPEDITGQVFDNAGRISQRLKNPSYINELSDSVGLKLGKAKELEMTRFGEALESSMAKNATKQVKLTDINSEFIANLKDVGLLNTTGELNQAFKGTGIAKVAQRMLNTFTKVARASDNIAGLRGKELADALQNPRAIKGFLPEKTLSFKELTRLWKTERNAITRDIFQQFEPKVTRPLAIYFDKVGERLSRVGGMEKANARYSGFMKVFRPIEEATGEPIAARRLLSSLDSNSIRQLGIDQLEAQLPKALHFSNDVLNFNSIQKLTKMDSPAIRAGVQKRMASFMDSVFSDTPTSAPRADLVERIIDPGLPKSLQLTERAKIHSSAKALHQSVFSILRAKFISGSIGIPGMVGAATGGMVGGPIGATIGLAGGFALQDPKILRALISISGSPSGRVLREVLTTLPNQLPPQVGSVLSGLLRLAQNNQ